MLCACREAILNYESEQFTICTVDICKCIGVFSEWSYGHDIAFSHKDSRFNEQLKLMNAAS